MFGIVGEPGRTKAMEQAQRAVARCEVTKNPVGTDTRPEGQPCECANCQAADTIASLTKEVERERAERIQAELRLGNDLAAAVLRARNAEATIERLREALEPFAWRVPASVLDSDKPSTHFVATSGIELAFFRAARAALQSTEQRT